MGDCIEVPLDLEDIEVLSSQRVGGVVEVHVRSTLTPCCLSCGSVDVVGHGRHRRKLRDRPCGGPVTLIWQQRRVRCRDCGATSRERHPMVDASKRATARLRRDLFDAARQRPFRQVAADYAVSEWRVTDAFDDHAALALRSRAQLRPRVIALDESAFRRGFKYKTVLFAPELRALIEMADGRTQAAVNELLAGLDHQVRDGVEVVVIDLFWPFRRAVHAALPQATVVADRFHVQRAVTAAANKVRIRLGRRPPRLSSRTGQPMARMHSARFDRRATTARWAFLRRAHSLDHTDKAVLAELFDAFPDAAVAWAMKEAFAGVYDAPSRQEAERRLDVWVANLEAAGLPELQTLWSQLSGWREQILAYHDHRHTNGFAEGMTNKIKVIKRSAYGFRNEARYRAKVLLSCQPRSA